MKSILLIRLTSLGDVVLATPIARILRSAYPDATINVAVDERFADVWSSNPHVDRVIAVSRGAEATVDAHAYDVIVDLQRNRRSARIIKRMQSVGSALVLRYSKHRFEKLAFVYLKRKPSHVDHIVQRYAEPLRGLNVHLDDEGLELWPQVTTHARLVGMTKQQQRLRIGIAPGAQHETKRYPPELMAQVVHALDSEHDAEVVLLGGTADVSLCDQIELLSMAAPARADGANSVAETVGVLDTLDAVISCDSAVVHMAAARNIPVVVVYGSTAPEFGFTPYNVSHAVVQAENVPCRPCTHIGRSSCPKGHFQCMTMISPMHIADAAADLALKHQLM